MSPKTSVFQSFFNLLWIVALMSVINIPMDWMANLGHHVQTACVAQELSFFGECRAGDSDLAYLLQVHCIACTMQCSPLALQSAGMGAGR